MNLACITWELLTWNVGLEWFADFSSFSRSVLFWPWTRCGHCPAADTVVFVSTPFQMHRKYARNMTYSCRRAAVSLSPLKHFIRVFGIFSHSAEHYIGQYYSVYWVQNGESAKIFVSVTRCAILVANKCLWRTFPNTHCIVLVLTADRGSVGPLSVACQCPVCVSLYVSLLSCCFPFSLSLFP